MYVLKKLHGVNAVQTLSRLNRICPPFDKKTFVLDFANDYADIEKAFSRYYTVTLLSSSINPRSIYDISAKIDGYFFLDPGDVEDFNTLLYKEKVTAADKKRMTFFLQKAKHLIENNHDEAEQKEIQMVIRHFIRCYEFLVQATCFEDGEIHKKYKFLSYLSTYLKVRHSGGGFDLTGKIKADSFVQKKSGEFANVKHKADPMVHLPTAESLSLTPAKMERLSQIIAEINSKTGKNYDNDVAVKAMLQIKDIMLKSEKLRASAQNNTERDFEFAYFDHIDDALIAGLEQNEDFFSLLLDNDEIKRQVLGIFANEVYTELKGESNPAKPKDVRK